MSNYSEKYFEVYQGLPEKLVAIYPEFNFDNHCYLRIALDNTFNAKWDTVLKRPAYRNTSEQERTNLLKLLKHYKTNKTLLLEHNKNSLQWRKILKQQFNLDL